MHFRLEKGLDIPVHRQAAGVVQSVAVDRVALLGADYGYPRVSLNVDEGDRVKAGQTLFSDRRHPDLRFTAPVSGRVREIRRGLRRRVETVVIDVDGDEHVAFPTLAEGEIASMPRDELCPLLLRSGLWTAFRARPFDRIPPPDIEPRAIFVTAIDTNPFAADPFIAIEEQAGHFGLGLLAVSRLTTGNTFVCTANDRTPPLPAADTIAHVQFSGPHPAGLPGTHIAAAGLAVSDRPDIWYLSAQDVIAIGRLLSTGRLSLERVIAVDGPGRDARRLLRVPPGADLAALTGDAARHPVRILSGSVLSGRDSPTFLGRYHQQVTLLSRSGGRLNAFAQAFRLMRVGGVGREAVAGADTHGWAGGMLPLETFDRVWPFSTPPAPLLRALLAGDDAAARRLGCLGLAEEDLALLSYVAADKQDYGAALRKSLDRIARSAP